MAKAGSYKTARELLDALLSGKITAKEFLQQADKLTDAELESLANLVREQYRKTRAHDN